MPSSTKSYIRTLLLRINSFFSFSQQTRAFKRLARENRVPKAKSKKLVLVEYRYWPDQMLALIGALPPILQFHNANARIYEMFPTTSKIFKVKRILKHKFSTLNAIAKSKYLHISASSEVDSGHQIIIDQLISRRSQKSLEEFKYRGILIGDLIYDHFLRKTKSTTLDFDNTSLPFFISEFLQYCDKFLYYFRNNEIEAVVVSHPVYHFGIPLRVALHHKIPGYLVDIRRFTKVIDFSKPAYNHDWGNLRQTFKTFDPIFSAWARDYSKKRIELRNSGDRSDLGGETKSKFNWGGTFDIGSLTPSKPSVLIALHDFIDSCHRYGNAFYPDFQLWLNDLGELSMSSNLVWLVKPHPWALMDVREMLREFIKRYPHIKIINPETDNRILVEKGLKYCLTVHGHIAHELPALGVAVINASVNHPHQDYDFSYTARDLESYREVIRNLESFKYQANLEDLSEFYYMHYVYNLLSWCIPNYADFVKDLEGRRELNTERVFSWFLKTRNKYELACLKQAVTEFLKGRDLILGRSHFPTEFCSFPRSCACGKLRRDFSSILS